MRLRPSRHRPAPDRFRACAESAHAATAQQMPLDVERIIDGRMHLKKALRRRPALEPQHFRSRLRMFRCEFSARLFSRNRPGRCRSPRPRCWSAAPYDRSPSVTMTSGSTCWFFNSRRMNRSATPALRRFCTSMSSTSPSSSTACQIHTRSPAMFETISPRYQRGDGGSLRRRRLAAIFGPNSLSRRGSSRSSHRRHDVRASPQRRAG